MVWHSINEAAKLVGRSRRSIYRDIGKGLVSSTLSRDGQRCFETSELLRVYGSFVTEAQSVTPDLAQPVTPPQENLETVLSELRELRQEVKELREAMRLLEYKPDPVAAPAPEKKARKTTTPTTWESLLASIGES